MSVKTENSLYVTSIDFVVRPQGQLRHQLMNFLFCDYTQVELHYDLILYETQVIANSVLSDLASYRKIPWPIKPYDDIDEPKYKKIFQTADICPIWPIFVRLIFLPNPYISSLPTPLITFKSPYPTLIPDCQAMELVLLQCTYLIRMFVSYILYVYLHSFYIWKVNLTRINSSDILVCSQTKLSI